MTQLTEEHSREYPPGTPPLSEAEAAGADAVAADARGLGALVGALL